MAGIGCSPLVYSLNWFLLLVTKYTFISNFFLHCFVFLKIIACYVLFLTSNFKLVQINNSLFRTLNSYKWCLSDVILSGHDLFSCKMILSYCTICQQCFLLLFYYLLTSIVLNSKRVSGFDQAPPQSAVPMVAAGVIPGMLEICIWWFFAYFYIFTYIYLCFELLTNGLANLLLCKHTLIKI